MRIQLCLAAALVAYLHSGGTPASEPLPRSILLIDQSIPYTEYFARQVAALRTTLKEGSATPIAFYSERLESNYFKGPEYERLLHHFIKEKYREKPIGVMVAVGFDALQFATRMRAELQPQPPIVFSNIDDDQAARLQLPPNVTGTLIGMSMTYNVKAARALVPTLKQIAVVGDPLEQQTYRRHYKRELVGTAGAPAYIDLTGLTLTQVRERVASLPDDAAIFYTSFSDDNEGVRYNPNEALALIAEVANRPIVVDLETRLGHGGTGGFLVQSAPIGEETARRVLRILNGEKASDIPIVVGDFVRPAFDWRQLRRWNISEASLPPGSVVRFREPTVWERYLWPTLLVLVVLLLQSALIAALLYQRRLLRQAERDVRHRASELAYVNRRVVAGQLSASIAHEINQPLAAIVSSGSAGLRWLTAKTPNLEEVAASLKRIVSDGHRAAQVVENVRAMFKRDVQTRASADINRLVAEVLDLMRSELERQHVAVKTVYTQNLPNPIVDRVQLQQVIINLIRNATDSMRSTTSREPVLHIRTEMNEAYEVLISIEDTGIGIDPKDADRLFEPFFTTKPDGMGMGLSICRSIVDAHGGRLSASPGRPHGAIFEIALPTKPTNSARA